MTATRRGNPRVGVKQAKGPKMCLVHPRAQGNFRGGEIKTPSLDLLHQFTCAAYVAGYLVQ